MIDLMLSKNNFSSPNVLGIPGHVFGRHPYQRQGQKVPTHPDWRHDVRIRWPTESEKQEYCSFNSGQPIIASHCMHWSMFESDLAKVENGLEFRVAEHCRALCREVTGRRAAILEWSCGIGNAVKELSLDPELQRNALIYGYGDVWDVAWNEIEGVKFLFFVKEHLLEYFRRTRQKIDFVFTHGAMEYLDDTALHDHLEGLGSFMEPGAEVVFPTSVIRRKILWELESFLSPPQGDVELAVEGKSMLPPCEHVVPCVLTRK